MWCDICHDIYRKQIVAIDFKNIIRIEFLAKSPV